MKTYQDLSDEQLVQLANLAAGTNSSSWDIDRNKEGVKLVTISTEVNFFHDDGDVMLERIMDYGPLEKTTWNIWQIVALCQSWGVDYSPKES